MIRKNKDAPLLPMLSQIRSNTSIEKESGIRISEPTDEDDDYFDEIQCSDIEEETDDNGLGEMQILLYHFMSIQALKGRDYKDFMGLIKTF